ncbi:cytochrome c oxidase cbb3-type subunit 1 [Haloferula luteola]|uniref:Cytochrome c oxidase cbb3-type subunit 1 n=1 Tax=Haloferula luteola TaxID=595692 RepID=A0A840V4Q3_9BACT|nr:hypothetical protein [Haloferula luteola]MBB5352543.1 cytochrome c oxidase cbb3-type subunit 1 [Haloferula luteola]
MNGGVRSAARHALGWLVVANAVGLWLSLLLLFPKWQVGEWTYGRWVPVHLNGQLYGWTALPMVAWLFGVYGVSRRWADAALGAWSAALAVGGLSWLNGGSSGKIFLDWKGGALAGLLVAMGILWVALWRGECRWRPVLRWGGLVGLAMIPVMMAVAASPELYPPIDSTTGGPTGSSLLGSTLFVVGLMMLLPASVGLRLATDGRTGRIVLGYFGLSWAVFGVTEFLGGTHWDFWQEGAMVMLVPWVVGLPIWWRRYEWPEGTQWWRQAMFGWWALLVLSGVTAYFPDVLDRLKFTQGLVAHSHLAMAGFTTSFCACLLRLLGVNLGSRFSAWLWQGAAWVMVGVLMGMGWAEGGGVAWMAENPGWRIAGWGIRSGCGVVMLAVSLHWWLAAGVSGESKCGAKA